MPTLYLGMKLTTRIALVLAGLALIPIPRSLAQPTAAGVALSPQDSRVALTASQLGARSPNRAREWLVSQSRVSSANFGRDGKTLDVHFRDGAEVALVPRKTERTALLSGLGFSPALVPHASGSAHAVVLEPFADELGLGESAGEGEIEPLKAAGFSVDVVRNSDVTVSVMENLANYSVIYMETHSGTLGDGDAIILTRQTDSSSVKSLFADGSVTQGLAYGDQNLYIALKAQFFLQHTGTYPNSTIVFLNGCEVLGANVLWDALRQHNVATLISWDNKAINTIDEQAADFMFPRLASGETVSAAIADAKAASLGVSTFDGVDAHLGYLGQGDTTFADALQGTPLDTPTPTATATSTDTPTATATATPTPHKVSPCKRKNYHRVHGTCVPKKKKKKK